MTRRRSDTPPPLLSDRAAQIATIVLLAVCAALVGCEFWYEKHPYFDFDSFFGLYPLAGFSTVVIAVLVARLMRPMIGRRENYYGEADPEVTDLDSEGGPHA